MDELISRQAAVDALNEQIEQCNKALGSFDISLKDEFAIKVERASLKAYREQLENLPPVQPERIKGHWIEIALRNHTYKCSVCGRLLVNITDGKNNVAKNYPYCHCGADMRGEEE